MEKKIDLILDYIHNTVTKEIVEGTYSQLMHDYQTHKLSKEWPTNPVEVFPELQELQEELQELWAERVAICDSVKTILGKETNVSD